MRAIAWRLALFSAVAALAAGALIVAAPLFAHGRDLEDIPALAFAAGLAAPCAAYLLVPGAIAAGVREGARARLLLGLTIALGLALRLAMLATPPVLEDDLYRYLWDGAVTAHGLNPYRVAPALAEEAEEATPIGRLGVAGQDVLWRINHPEIRTIYPPVAQAAFALGYALGPFSVTAWRIVCIAGEIATLLLLIAALDAVGRSRLWAALYWLNPLVIKELINSAHMEAVLMPLVVAAVLLAIRRRPLAMATALGAAAGVKLWPLLLVPVLLRHAAQTSGQAIAAVSLLGALLGVMAAPIVLAGLDETSGFVAYATYWTTNSALFPLIEAAAGLLTAPLSLTVETTGRLARAALALSLAAAALALARQRAASDLDLVLRVQLLTGLLVLLAPAQFPWYAAWVLVFLPFRPAAPLLALTALMPLYYVAFHLIAIDRYDALNPYLVLAIWLPVWVLVAREIWRRRGSAGVPFTAPRPAD